MGKGTLGLLKGGSQKDVDGVWFQYKDHDIHLLIARLGNIQFEKEIVDLLRSDTRDLGSASKIASKAVETQPEAVAKTILLDWKGVFEEDGTEISYTPKLGLKYFRDPEFHWFYKYVLQCANDVDKFEAVALEAELGNSESASSGN